MESRLIGYFAMLSALAAPFLTSKLTAHRCRWFSRRLSIRQRKTKKDGAGTGVCTAQILCYRMVSIEVGVEAVGEPDDAAVEMDAARDAIAAGSGFRPHTT